MQKTYYVALRHGLIGESGDDSLNKKKDFEETHFSSCNFFAWRKKVLQVTTSACRDFLLKTSSASMEKGKYRAVILLVIVGYFFITVFNILPPKTNWVAEFLIENHIFPKKHFEPSGRFHFSRWNKVPGINILEHIYRESPDRKIYHPHKMIVQPRLVEQTSVHEVLKKFGLRYKVPMDVCRIVHVRVALQGSLKLEQLNEDKRLWDFQEKLIPNVDKALQRAGMLRVEERS
ncbi:hypothetical protein FQA47_012441 [Oryzias melastigma]|uniref:Uncharacterized protein n=1 Tax=Oryzias melastigma TaxID=30732 RepID=A0A834BYM1_ORYME|nr:hypothetical protein FQA47_012441 [Oryzias melastigma]